MRARSSAGARRGGGVYMRPACEQQQVLRQSGAGCWLMLLRTRPWPCPSALACLSPKKTLMLTVSDTASTTLGMILASPNAAVVSEICTRAQAGRQRVCVLQ